MKLGLNMYLRAIAQLFVHLWPALLATGPAWVASTVLTGVAANQFFGDLQPTQSATDGQAFSLPPLYWTYFLLTQALNFITFAYIGPKFHRAMLPNRHFKQSLPFADYLMALMKLAFIGFVLTFGFSRVIALVAPTVPGPLGHLTIPIVCLFITLYMVLRLSLVLPSIALSRPRDLISAWRLTRPFKFSGLVSLVLLTITVAGLHSFALLWSGAPWAGLALGAIASWFALVTVLSYLSILYRDARRIEHGMVKPT
ncbi:MAG: hypothetical protein ABJ327_24725 [Litoreibacter sp.]